MAGSNEDKPSKLENESIESKSNRPGIIKKQNLEGVQKNCVPISTISKDINGHSNTNDLQIGLMVPLQAPEINLPQSAVVNGESSTSVMSLHLQITTVIEVDQVSDENMENDQSVPVHNDDSIIILSDNESNANDHDDMDTDISDGNNEIIVLSNSDDVYNVANGTMAGSNEDKPSKLENESIESKSNRPGIIKKQNFEGVQKNCVPISTISKDINGHSNTNDLQIGLIIPLQAPEINLPQSAAVNGESSTSVMSLHLQITTVNEVVGQVSDENMENNKSVPVHNDESIIILNDNESHANDRNDIANSMDIASSASSDGNYEVMEMLDSDDKNIMENGFDHVKSDDMNPSVDLVNQPSLKKKSNLRGRLLPKHHFKRDKDIKIRASKPSPNEELAKKLVSAKNSEWKTRRLLEHFNNLANNERKNIKFFTEYLNVLEIKVLDPEERSTLIKLTKRNLQTCEVALADLEKIPSKIMKIFEDNKKLTDDFININI